MKHGKTPTPVGAAGRLALVAVTILGMLAGNGTAQDAKPKRSSGPELFTNIYVVPPTFGLSSVEESNPDPFAAPAHEGGTPIRRPAKEVLEEYGISFGEGTSALYNPQTSQLIVRQTQDQMMLVEAVLESLRDQTELQIHLSYQIIESRERLLEPEKKSEDRKNALEVDPDSGARRVREKTTKPKPLIPPLAIAGEKVFTIDQLESFLDEIEASKRGKIRRSGELLVRSGQRCEMWVADAFAEIDPVIGGDNFTIDLNLSMKNGRLETRPTATTDRQITMWNGQTAAFEEKLEDGTFRTRLVTAQIVDPAGLPVEEPSPNLQTRTFSVPGFPTHDPINQNAHEVRKVLEKHGIGLGEESRALFNPATDVLLVRATPDVLQAIEALAEEDWKKPREWPDKQIFFTVREAIIEGLDTELDWLLVEGAGENSSPDQEVREESGRSLPRIAGVFTDPQFQVLIRVLNKQKGVTLSSAPSVVANSGDVCSTEVNGRKWGFHGLIGPDGYTVQVKFAAADPSEENWPEKLEESETPGVEVTIWEGQTIAYSEKIGNEGKTRVTFIKAQTIEEAGQEVSQIEKKPEGLTTDQQNAVKKADELALRGSQLLADGEIAAAVEKFSESVKVLPEHPLTEDRSKAYREQWERAKQKVADLAKDQETPSLFPSTRGYDFHAEFEVESHERLVYHDVFRGETLFGIAQKYETTVDRLRVINRMPSNYLKVGDRLLVPVRVKPELPSWEQPEELESPTAMKAGAIILPAVEFHELPLMDALAYLQTKSVELDQDSPEAERGITITLLETEAFADTRITLRLKAVPLGEALRYTAELAHAKVGYEDDAVVISPRDEVAAAPQADRGGAGPEDIWFRAYTLLQEGEVAESEGKQAEALGAFRQSELLFKSVAEKYPAFYPDLVEYRLEQLRKKIERFKTPEAKQPK